MIKNFSKQPNSFILDEKKEHSLTGLIKNSTEKLILIIMHGCKEKYGGEFQKSENQLANMCLMARSTFQRNINEMIAKGIISKRVEKKDNSKENEACYWTVNIQFEYETDQNDTTLTQNDTGVAPKQDNGCPNTGQKEESLKESLKDFEEDDINKRSKLISYWSATNEIKNMKEFLMNKGFNHDTINKITQKVVDKIVDKKMRSYEINERMLVQALDSFNKDKNNAKSYDGLFVYKLEKAIESYWLERNHQQDKIDKYEEAL